MDKDQLENWTGTPARWLAYPFGEPKNVSLQAVNFIKRMGFLAAFTLVPGCWQPGDDRFTIGRDGLSMAQPAWLWRAWLDGSYDSLYSVQTRLKLWQSPAGPGIRWSPVLPDA